ncbi:mechanosensitive ion channel family protein [Candidatus Saccharibacteria bacterium]|nr:mechanosensitive ion channel family protein [Candidatus Saccharibacteria bacterium]
MFEFLGEENELLKKVLYALTSAIVAFFFYFILKRVVSLVLTSSKKRLKESQIQRINTLEGLILNVIKYVVLILATLAILASFGVDVSSLLAGLGIGAAVIGLALQDLAKDIIAGISIVSEGKYEVGDLIEIDGFKGRVTYLGLKTTRVKNYRGQVRIISNRTINTVTNYSLNDTLAEITFYVAYKEDAENVEKILEKIKKKLDGKFEEMTGEIHYYGSSELGDSGVKYRMTCPCKPYKHFKVQRELRKEVKRAFDEAKIEIPVLQIKLQK